MSDVKILARKLDSRNRGEEITEAESQQAGDTGLVVVFGYSDDGMIFAGEIDDSVGCDDGGFAYLSPSGLVENDCGSEYCPHYKRAIEAATTIEAVWGPSGDLSWSYKTDIPHEKFIINEYGEPWCEGIVFSMADISVKEGSL